MPAADEEVFFKHMSPCVAEICRFVIICGVDEGKPMVPVVEDIGG
jgi:hypothetical protein